MVFISPKYMDVFRIVLSVNIKKRPQKGRPKGRPIFLHFTEPADNCERCLRRADPPLLFPACDIAGKVNPNLLHALKSSVFISDKTPLPLA